MDETANTAPMMRVATLHVTLPWPPRELSPNARHAHWSSLARAKRRYRAACHLEALAGHCRRMAHHTRLHLHLAFVPPDRRARDLDNCIAAMKAGLDGLADVLGVDDSRWALTAELDQSQIGGFVRVEVSPWPAQQSEPVE